MAADNPARSGPTATPEGAVLRGHQEERARMRRRRARWERFQTPAGFHRRAARERRRRAPRAAEGVVQERAQAAVAAQAVGVEPEATRVGVAALALRSSSSRRRFPLPEAGSRAVRPAMVATELPGSSANPLTAAPMAEPAPRSMAAQVAKVARAGKVAPEEAGRRRRPRGLDEGRDHCEGRRLDADSRDSGGKGKGRRIVERRARSPADTDPGSPLTNGRAVTPCSSGQMATADLQMSRGIGVS